MRYDAITLDTNIFRQHGYRLEGGLLGLLSQFKTGSVQFVLSEVVFRELNNHLKVEGNKATDALDRAIEDVVRAEIAASAEAASLEEIRNGKLGSE